MSDAARTNLSPYSITIETKADSKGLVGLARRNIDALPLQRAHACAQGGERNEIYAGGLKKTAKPERRSDKSQEGRKLQRKKEEGRKEGRKEGKEGRRRARREKKPREETPCYSCMHNQPTQVSVKRSKKMIRCATLRSHAMNSTILNPLLMLQGHITTVCTNKRPTKYQVEQSKTKKNDTRVLGCRQIGGGTPVPVYQCFVFCSVRLESWWVGRLCMQ